MPKKKTDQELVVSPTGAAAAPAKTSPTRKVAAPRTKASTGTRRRTTKTNGSLAVVEPPGADPTLDHHEVARLAYSYWAARDFQGGSSEEDWYRAEAELRNRRHSGR